MPENEEEACECGIPHDAVILRELRIIEYMDTDGAVYKVDLSHDGSGHDLDFDGVVALSEWCKALTVVPMLADMVAQFLGFEEEEGDDGDEETAEVQ